MSFRNHRDLKVWQRSLALSVEIYNLTKGYPDYERFGLVSQMQRSSASAPSNIAEGNGRESDTELNRFLNIAYGSLSELDTQIELSFLLGYISLEQRNYFIKQ